MYIHDIYFVSRCPQVRGWPYHEVLPMGLCSLYPLYTDLNRPYSTKKHHFHL